MLVHLFSVVCFLSLAGSGAVLAVWAACRLGGGRMSCRWRYYVWLLPMVLLLLPVTPPHASPAAAPAATAELAEPGPAAGGAEGRDGSPQAPPAALHADVTGAALPGGGEAVPPSAPQAEGRTAPALRAAPLTRLPAGLWLTGVLALAARYLAQIFRFRRFLRRVSQAAEPWEEEALVLKRAALNVRRPVALRRYAGAGSPFLSGMLCPVIFLPETGLTSDELDRVLAHELTHCRRRDLLVKRLAWLVRTVHWFNPLAWLLERQVAYRCELACDEAVAAGLDRAGRRAYGLTILRLMRERTGGLPASACLAEYGIANRMEELMEMREKGRGRRVLAAALAAALCLGGTALAAGVNGRNPVGTYRAAQFTDLFYVNFLAAGESGEAGDRYSAGNYGPGSGYNRAAQGEALLVDTPLKKSFSAELRVGCLWSYDRNAGPADALPASVFQVEMTRLDGVLADRGEWVGRFTVRQDGTPIFVDEPGRLACVPSLDGARLTALTVGPDGANYFYVRMNFGLSGTAPLDGDAAAYADIRALEEHPDTASIRTRQSAEAAVDGYTAVPYFVNDFFVNDTLGQAGCDLILMAEGVYGSRYVPAETARLRLELRPRDVKRYDGDSAQGTFFLQAPNGQDRTFAGAIRGLNGGPGDTVSIRADDGSLALDFAIETDRRGDSGSPPAPQTGGDPYEGLSGEQRAEMQFHDTCELWEGTEHVGTDEIPFAITTEGNTVFVRYTGDPKYRAGAQLYWINYGDLSKRHEAKLLSGAAAAFLLPETAPTALELELYQVSTADGADFLRHTLTLYPGPDGALVTDCLRYHMYNSHYTGEAAEAALNYGNRLVPAFMQ